MERIVRSLLARADLLEIWLFLAEKDQTAADRVIDTIDATIHLLSKYPELGTRHDELRKGLRRFVVGRFLIFYLPTEDDMKVVRILHGARKYEAEL